MKGPNTRERLRARTRIALRSTFIGTAALALLWTSTGTSSAAEWHHISGSVNASWHTSDNIRIKSGSGQITAFWTLLNEDFAFRIRNVQDSATLGSTRYWASHETGYSERQNLVYMNEFAQFRTSFVHTALFIPQLPFEGELNY